MAKQMSRIQKVWFALKTKTSLLLFKVFIIGLWVFSSSYYLAQAAICPSSVPSSSATIKEQYNFTGYSNVQTYGLVAGPVSSSLYYMYYLSTTPNKVAVRKVDASSSQSWIASFNFWPILKCLSVDLAEQSLYLANNDSTILTVLRLSTLDGSVVSQHQL